MSHRHNRADPLAPLVAVEQLAIIGGLGFLAYWILSGGAKAFFCPGGGGLCSLFPAQTTVFPSFPIGTGISSTTNLPGQNPTIPSGDLIAVTSAGPQTFGPNGIVPGTGQSVQDLRSAGYSDNDIAGMIEDFISNPGAYSDNSPAGGAGGSF